MSKTPKAAPATKADKDITAAPMPDPKRLPVTFVNTVAGAGFVNGVVNITFAVARFTPTADANDTLTDLEVASRLRMDLYCAQELHKTLGVIIEQNTKPATKPN